MPALQGRWCPSCGTGVGWQDEVCPNCGMTLERSWGQPQGEEPVVEPEESLAPAFEQMVDESADTRAIPRIESAIPAEDDPTSKVAVLEGMPRANRFMLASVASIALVCGLAVAITHPWNPDAYSIKATEEADTSMAGFPGTVESLSGQDNGGGTQEESLSGDEATLKQLTEAYEKLGRYATRADESEGRLDEEGLSADADTRAEGKREVEALAIDVSNLIDDVTQVDVTSGVYTEEREHLLTLGSWLRNRVDVLREAWGVVADAGDTPVSRDDIDAVMAKDRGEDGQSAYSALFSENYDAWKPQAHEAE